jgi:putative tricarboxylic transport membrane protein
MMGKKLITKVGLIGMLGIGMVGCSNDTSGSSEDKYPTKNIEFLVAAGPGGGTDNFARTIQTDLEEKFDTNINVVNLGASSGATAHQNTANSDPDGHTIEFASSTYITTLAAGQNNTGLDKLTPVARLQSDILTLVINPKKYKNFDEFYEHAKANPGEVVIGGVAAASPDEMTFMEFKEETGLDINFIPYDGSGNSTANLLGGNIDAMFDELGSVLDYINSGEMKFGLIFSDERLEEFPDVPTSVEKGWNITNGNERGVFVNSDTPKETITKIETALKEIYDSSEYKKYEEKNLLHYREGWLGADEYREKWEKDLARYKELLGKN